MNAAQLYFGIYLGADKCAIASYDGVESKIYKNNEGFEYTPTAVWMDSKERLHVGRRAKDQLENDPGNAFSEFKLQMGSETQYTFARNKKKVSPQELSAEVLKALKEDVRRQIGEEVTSVVITVPAAFELPQCQATNKAAELAGFVNHPLLQEPIAAAMAYGFQSETTNKFWMVYDFGGGTFEATIIQIKDGQIEVVNHGGDNGLGGKNLDWEIVNSLLAPAAAQVNNLNNFTRNNKQFRKTFAKLKAEAEKAKIRLSLEDSVEIFIGNLYKNEEGESVKFSYELFRSDIERLAKPYIIQSINICKKILYDSKLKTSDVEKIILVGGTSQISFLQHLLKEELRIPLDMSIDPTTVYVKGAAIFASTQRIPFNPNTEVQKDEFLLELDYQPIGPDSEPPVGGRVISKKQNNFEGYTIEFVNKTARPEWRSGKVGLNSEGGFITQLWAEKGKKNEFLIELFDQTGSKQKTIPENIFYTYGEVSTNKNFKNMDTIEKRVIEEIELWSNQDEINLDDNLWVDFGDDCDIDDLQRFIEIEFDFEIGLLDEEIYDCDTVSDLIELVESKLNNEDEDEESTPHKNDITKSQTNTRHDKKYENELISSNDVQQQPKLDCEILMQAAAPDIYRINAFRISGLNVSATTREISSQVQKNQMMEKYGGKMDNHKSPFPIEPPPDIDKLRQALHRLRDPETRIIDEFFWFWPHSIDNEVKDHALEVLSRNDIKTAESLWINYEATFTESNVSRHNLAVLSHLLVLDIELNGNSLTKDESAKRDKLWKDTFKRWKLLLEHEGFWSRLTARVRQMDDPRLNTGFVKRLREALPNAILQINGIIAVEFAEKGKDEEAKRHLDLIRSSGFDSDVIDRALKTAVDPVRKRIKVICLSASDESEKNNIRAIEFGRQILTQTQNPLKTLKILLPEKSIIIEGAEDDITDNVINCYIKYVNKTEDYVSALELIKSAKNFINSSSLKAKVDEKIKLIKGILEYSNFWRLEGYFSYPSNCIDMMEKAYDLEEALKFDEAINLLRKGIYSLPEVQESDSLRKQFLHCIAYCLRRKSVNIYNEAFDEYNSEFDKKYNNLVKYRVYISEYSSMINCAHCYGYIYSTYYTRTINGIKQPFCDSCNNRINREFNNLEEELKKEIKKALDLILLSKFLSPNHNPTKIDFTAIKESADKRNIRSAEISDLLLKYNMLDMSETIKLLTSGSGKKDSKLYSHLISILESQNKKVRIKSFNTLINDPSALIKELKPYFLTNETVFNDFLKFVFDPQYNLSANKRQDILNYLLREGNFHIWFRLLAIPGILNEQNIFDSIVKRLIESIHEIITKISFDDISFKYGEPGAIIQKASEISEDLKSRCIIAIISAASKEKSKALKIVSAIYEDKLAEQLFFQILYSDDTHFDKQMRIQYYVYLLGHWESTIRKKSIEWLNSNITDKQTKIKYLITSLADPDNLIQAFAHDQIKKYPEEAVELLLVASYTTNSYQIFHIRSLLKTFILNHNWKSKKANYLSTLLKVCLTHKDKEISQLTFNIIEMFYAGWTSSQDAKSCLKNIKFTAKMGKGHNSQIASEILAKFKTASFMNRILIIFSGSEQLKTPTVADWYKLVLLEKDGTTEIGSFIPSGNIADDLFNTLKKYRNKLKHVKISGFSKICYGHQISPDGSVLVLTVFKEKGIKYDWDKEKRNFWDLYSLDLNSSTLKRLFYIQDFSFSDVVMLGDSFYSIEASGRVVGWNWRKTNDFNFINIKYDYSTYPKRLNDDLLIEEHNGKVDELFSLKNNLKKIDFFLTEGETLQSTHKSKNYILIYKRPIDKEKGYEDYDAPKSYLLVSLNDSLSKSSRKEVLKESYEGEINDLDFYGDNHIIYSKETSKDSEKYDIYIQDLDDNKKYQKVISKVNSGYIWSKPGYILYTNYIDSTESTDLIIHDVSSSESVKLLTLTNDCRDFNISEDWSTFSFLKQTESGNTDDVPCNIYLVNLDMDKEFKDDIHIKKEDNSYVKIGNSKK